MRRISLHSTTLLRHLNNTLHRHTRPNVTISIQKVTLPIQRRRITLALRRRNLTIIITLSRVTLNIRHKTRIRHNHHHRHNRYLRNQYKLTKGHNIVLNCSITLTIHSNRQRKFTRTLTNKRLIRSNLHNLNISKRKHISTNNSHTTHRHILQIKGHSTIRSPRHRSTEYRIVSIDRRVPHRRHSNSSNKRHSNSNAPHRQRVPGRVVSNHDL